MYIVQNLTGSPEPILSIIQKDLQTLFVLVVINKYSSVDFEKLLMQAVET